MVACVAMAALAVGAPHAQEAAGIKLVVAGSLELPAALAGADIDGIAADSAGNVYLGVTTGSPVDRYVVVYDASGSYVRHWLIDSRQIRVPQDDVRLATGPDGNVYVAPHASEPQAGIKVFTPDGTPVRTFGEGSHLKAVSGIGVDAGGNVFVTSRASPSDGIADDVVVKFDPAGQVAARFAPFPGDPGRVSSNLTALGIAADGSLWVGTEKSKEPIVHLDGGGKRIAGPDFDIVLPSQLRTVDDLEFTGNRLYIAGHLGEQRTPIALLVVSPNGRLEDSVAGLAHYVAVGSRVYLSGHEKPTARVAAAADGGVSQYVPVPTTPGPQTSVYADCESGGSVGGDVAAGHAQLRVPRRNAPSCEAVFQQTASPWPKDSCSPVGAYLGGEPLDDYAATDTGGAAVVIRTGEMRSGSVILEWACSPSPGVSDTRYENKGEIVLYDPSGVVLAGKSSKPVAGASVRLQFSPAKGGKFGTPALPLMDPQLNPQTTQRDGAFGWDVAAGFWRLRITAYGYRPFLSKVYKIPPEVTGLKLRLKPDPKQQAKLLDPLAGRAGAVKLGAKKPKQARGLKLTVTKGKVRRIEVRSGAYRTVLGVRLGSPALSFRRAFAAQVIPADRKARKPLTRYRVGKATFTIKKNRVVAIVFGA
jgi:hypothetical protein